MLRADYGWLFARIARMPETRSRTLAYLPEGTWATSAPVRRQGLSCKGGWFHASDDYVYYELGGPFTYDLASTHASSCLRAPGPPVRPFYGTHRSRLPSSRRTSATLAFASKRRRARCRGADSAQESLAHRSNPRKDRISCGHAPGPPGWRPRECCALARTNYRSSARHAAGESPAA